MLDEPEHFVGQRLRLVTVAGREHEGVLKAVTSERRLVLALPQGANQVDFQFHPVDIALIEVRPGSDARPLKVFQMSPSLLHRQNLLACPEQHQLETLRYDRGRS
ncbi:hypothetical protein UMZ34_22775 [Halopseudomonas pachastrellae]|nr:hypothetical protein UMZ34_22775 [Halopseudomonas pachastrellae]